MSVLGVVLSGLAVLLILLAALGAVVKFTWGLYIKITDKIEEVATAVHLRIATLEKEVSVIDKDVAVLKDKKDDNP